MSIPLRDGVRGNRHDTTRPQGPSLHSHWLSRSLQYFPTPIANYKLHQQSEVTIDPSSKIQNLNSPIAPTDGNPTDCIFKRRG